MAHFNLDRAELEADRGTPEGVDVRAANVAGPIGARHLGGNVLEIAPGARGWPYHWEAAQEEWLLVLAGTPTVRTPEGEEVLRPGDLVCFPPGPDGAHQLRNDGDEPCRVFMLSNRAEVNVIAYLDTGKIGVRTPWLRPTLRADATVPYWEGE